MMRARLLLVLVVLALDSCGPTAPPATLPPAVAPLMPSATATSAAPTRVIVVGFDDWSMADIVSKMPNLWAFMQKGALAQTGHASDLPQRSAPGFASIASGQYPDRHGVLNNSFIASLPRAGFAYWDNLAKRNPPTFLSDPPWVAFNRAGWDVGAIGWNGLALEERADVNAYLGRDVGNDLDQYWGISIHRKDGKVQFGTAEIPELHAEFPAGWKNGWAGPPRKSASVTLPMAATLLKSGVPLLFVYVENTHGRCGDSTQTCQSDIANGSFDDLLQADDVAFGKFFSDLEKMNITSANTLFVFTTDEQDHYLASYAKIVDTTDLQPSIGGSGAGFFYGSDPDAISAALASRPGVQFIVTREAMKALHMAVGADARTPTISAFSDADYYFNRGACAACGRWNHATVDPDIVSWLALVGPGIKRGAITGYSDHVDILPTIRAALGMPAAADVDGIPIFSALDRSTNDDLLQAREAYKQLDAPLGSFGLAILRISTAGARGGSAARTAADERISQLSARRTALISELRPALDVAMQLSQDQMAEWRKRAQELLEQTAQ